MKPETGDLRPETNHRSTQRDTAQNGKLNRRAVIKFGNRIRQLRERREEDGEKLKAES
jgi:hypothetical protein